MTRPDSLGAPDRELLVGQVQLETLLGARGDDEPLGARRLPPVPAAARGAGCGAGAGAAICGLRRHPADLLPEQVGAQRVDDREHEGPQDREEGDPEDEQGEFAHYR